MFVDEVTILVTAGRGGDGCTSFRREKYVDMGGPNGGNGGRGSSIIFRTNKGLRTLIDLKVAKHIKGVKGENGKGSNKFGANAEDIYIDVPMGTTIIDANTNEVIADLTHEDESVVVARGGRGGRGNKAFATHDNPAPKMSELGEPGEEKKIKCDLKVLADVGLVGMPSVGKSTLINMISNCNAKIGAYHFTTLSPNLGVVKLKDQTTFVMADLPGLIEGAADGVGLGHEFLRHAMRTKVICHVVDMGSEEGRDPIEDFKTIVSELDKYDESLNRKPRVIVANKMDLPNAQENLDKFKKEYKNELIFPVIAFMGDGLEELITKLGEIVAKEDEVKLYNQEKDENHLVFKYEDVKPFTITRQNDVWVVKGKEVENLLLMTRFEEEESVDRFGRKLRGMGVEEALEKAGAQRGDEVQILDYIFEFKE